MQANADMVLTPETVRALLDGATPGKYTLDPHSDMDDCLYDIWCGDQNGICVAENMLHRDACLFLAAPDLARAYLAVCEERDAAIERATIAHKCVCELMTWVSVAESERDAAHAKAIAEGMEAAAVIDRDTLGHFIQDNKARLSSQDLADAIIAHIMETNK